MTSYTLSRAAVRRFYDSAAPTLERAERYEAQAKATALRSLSVTTTSRVLHVGVGAGRDHQALAAAVGEQGALVGLDLSMGLLEQIRRRAPLPLCQGDAVALPFAAGAFDRLFSAYLLDLLPDADILLALREFYRVLAPGGRMVLVSLTEGADPLSRAFVALWRARFRLAPASLGGCRPVQLADRVQASGFSLLARQVVVQRGFPSEIVVAGRP